MRIIVAFISLIKLSRRDITYIVMLIQLFISVVLTQTTQKLTTESQFVWIADNGNGSYSNPIIYSDYSDPDAICVNNDFYLVSSSFNCTPTLPVLYSKDLVNWKIINHISENLPSPLFDKPQHGKGVWAPSIRFNNNKFYVFYADPDFGIFMSNSEHPAQKWEPLFLVKSAKGWIDPCPFWDDDGKAYIVHAWAKSRVGFNSILTMRRMSADGKSILDDSVNVFDGNKNHPTIEGPKLYKRNGYYYIFAPAGGVKPGWQTILRSENIFGPYEDKIVLEQGTTTINGPHQGAWIETQSGESWFIHFQDRDAYGRVVHLQPMRWENDWPVMGVDYDKNRIGEPVLTWKKPNVGNENPIIIPQTSDEFDSTSLGLQWQWHANHNKDWYSLLDKKGKLRLFSVAEPIGHQNLWDVPNLLLQKFPAPKFSITTQLEFHPTKTGDRAGLVIMGFDYSFIGLLKKANGVYLIKNTCKDADKGSAEIQEEAIQLDGNSIILRVVVDTGAVCRFSYSKDGKKYEAVGMQFTAREGRWIGAKVGLFALKSADNSEGAYTDFDWFRIIK